MLIFPDVEKETRDYLLTTLTNWDGLDVRMEVPDDLDWQIDKPTLVVVTVTGSGARTDTVYEQVLIGFDCYAPTQTEASLLAREVRAVIGNWPYVSGMVAGQSDNARPARTSQDDVSYPAYWYAANIKFKATNFNL